MLSHKFCRISTESSDVRKRARIFGWFIAHCWPAQAFEGLQPSVICMPSLHRLDVRPRCADSSHFPSLPLYPVQSILPCLLCLSMVTLGNLCCLTTHDRVTGVFPIQVG